MCQIHGAGEKLFVDDAGGTLPVADVATGPRRMRAKDSGGLRGGYRRRTAEGGDFRTGLFAMSKRCETGSPWPPSNRPREKDLCERPDFKSNANGECPPWQVVQAGTAVPSCFAPESIVVGRNPPLRGGRC